MTAIADAKLQELWDEITAYTPGSREAFIAALNSRLEAADAIATRLEWHAQYCDIAAREKSITLLTAYRQSKERM